MLDCQEMRSSLDGFSHKLNIRAYQECIPIKGIFELTARCNMNCKMCYVHLSKNEINKIGRELTNEEWLKIAKEAKEAGTLYLTLTGGEVFVRPGFRELYEALSEMGFLIQIYSNGYAVDEEVVEWLKQRPPMALRFTLYGASNETYQRVCGVRDGYDRVIRAIDLVKEAQIPLYTVGTIIKDNVKDLEKLYLLAREKKIKFQHSIGVFPAVRGATQDAVSQRIVVQDFSEEELYRSKKIDRMYFKTDHLFGRCRNYRTGYYVSWDGQMLHCAFMEQPKVSLLTTDFITAWKKMNEKLDKILIPEKCLGCKYEGFCQRCPGILAAECGKPNAITDTFCQRAKILYEHWHSGEVEDEKEIY